MSEHRQHPRKAVQTTAKFRAAPGGPLVEAEVHDISIGGMFIETATPAPFGAEVVVFLTLPGLRQETEVKAIVRWTKPNGMGVQFGVMGARETHALTQLLAGG